MNQEDIFKKIGHILNELNDQYQYLAQNPQELNELELELFLANASFLTDHVQIIKKLNSNSAQKALPEHTASAEPVQETISLAPESPAHTPEAVVIDAPLIEVPAEELIPEKPILEQEIFKLDNGSSTFEFILSEKPSSDRFEFEEKSVDEIFDRPLSKEEEEIIALKQKLRESDSLESDLPEEDEIGPEPFLVEHPIETEDTEEYQETEEEPSPIHVPEEKPFTAHHTTVTFAEPAEELKYAESANPLSVADEDIAKPVEPSAVPSETAPVEQAFVKPLAEVTVQPAETTFVKPAAESVKPETGFAAPVTEPATPAPKLTLNDILSGNTQGGTPKTEGGRPAITDLKQAISLNDKLRYIRDLFNGYNLAYAEAIDLLNKMPDFKTADAFLQNNYAVKNNWSAKQDTTDQFYELLNLRFPAK